MYTKLRTTGKKLLSKLLPDSAKLRYLSYLPKLESFRKIHSEDYPIFTDRFTMYQYINDEILKNMHHMLPKQRQEKILACEA